MAVITPRQIVSVHTHKGVQLHQFNPEQQLSLTWGRELRETSQCQITVPTPFATNQLPNIHAWAHWVTVWEDNGTEVLWRGPIQSLEADRTTLAISARDSSAYYQRQRTPLTKRWDAADPAVIASELWDHMLENKGLNVKPQVRPDPLGDRFDYHAEFDVAMMEANISELVQMGLRWTVVAGVPILGPLPLKPVTALGEEHFVGGGLKLLRDGANTFNNVVLRASDTISRAREHIPGQDLQTIVDIDSMSGVSNADKAVRQYVREHGRVRDALVVPPDAELHPDAPVTIKQLMPSARFTVEGFGLLSLMELQSVKVSVTPNGARVSVNLEGVNDDPPELDKIVAQKGGGL